MTLHKMGGVGGLTIPYNNNGVSQGFHYNQFIYLKVREMLHRSEMAFIHMHLNSYPIRKQILNASLAAYIR